MSAPKQKAEEECKSNPYELYLVCKSNIPILQGKNPVTPLNKNPDFYVGDIFQGKISSEYKDYIQFRAASRTNKKQWLHVNEKYKSMSIMNIFPPSIDDYFHLSIGDKGTAKCKYLTSFLMKYIDETYGLYLDELCGVIVTFLPFSYPVFTINGTLYRGRGFFTQFCVPYFHSKSHCKEYLSRIEDLREDTIEALSGRNMDEWKETKKILEYEYEKKLMLRNKELMKDDNTMEEDDDDRDEEEKEEEEEYEKIVDAEYLNEIVSVKKGSLPKWITSVYESIAGKDAYYYCIELYFMENDCVVPFQKDEYLEQNKYLDFEIKNKEMHPIESEESQNKPQSVERSKRWNKPQLMAFKIGNKLQDMIEVNEKSGSRWFDIEFNPKEALNDEMCKIYHDTVKVFRCKVGGKWQGDSKSRHYVDVKNKTGDIFNQYLPMIVINLVL